MINIKRDYRLNFDLIPDAIYAWEVGEELRKPHPYTLRDIMRKFDLKANEILMVDDMKNGYEMAKSCNVPFAFAGWSLELDEIGDFMKRNADYYLPTVESLQTLLFDT